VASALVVVLVIVGAFVAFTSEAPSWQRNDEGRAAVAAARNLARAATDLAKVPAARLTGTLAGKAGRSIPVDITVSSEGSGRATLTVGGEQVEAVVLPDVLYVKASEAFWRREGAAADTVADFGTQWVKADPELFGGDLTTVLSPGALGRLLDPHEGERPVAGDVERVNGVEVRPMRVNGLTAYVTTAEPHRIVRLTTGGPAASGTPSPGIPSALTGRGMFARARMPGRAPGTTGFAVDVADLTDAQVDTLFTDLTQRIGGLKDSIDSQVRFSLAGQITLAPCSTNGCQANVTIANRVQTNSPYLSAQQPVNATVTIAMTLDARPINTCNNAVTMPPNGSVTTTCFASYVIPPSRNPRTHIVEATARAVARALVQADVDRLVKDLDAEFARYRRKRDKKPTPTASRPGFETPTGTPTPTRTGKATPTAKPTTDPECEALPVLTGSGRTHTKRRHYKNGRHFNGPEADSEWSVDESQLPGLVQAAHAAPGVYQPFTGNCVRVHDAGDFIGTRPPGVKT
jgi:hypothetical protein